MAIVRSIEEITRDIIRTRNRWCGDVEAYGDVLKELRNLVQEGRKAGISEETLKGIIGRLATDFEQNWVFGK